MFTRKDQDAIALLAESVMEDPVEEFGSTLVSAIYDGEVSDVGLMNYIEKQETSILQSFYDAYIDEQDDPSIVKAVRMVSQLVDSGTGNAFADDGSGYEDGTGFEIR